MKMKLLYLLNNHDVLLVTGPSQSGKTWFLNTISKRVYHLDKKPMAIAGLSTRLTIDDYAKIAATSKKVIAIDEAQLLQPQQLIDVLLHVISHKLKLVLVCQYSSQLPLDEIHSYCTNLNVEFEHVMLTGWNNTLNEPESAILGGQVTSERYL